ncbi:hypothetical protein SDRG_01291 [Saprolegnia diclina VS20]|uniref:TNFR-Cys domain-containing protein n=1 Tax=Saprolegnia diclina (strain VS20) TaxID=1156394 RepID=T0R2Y2_SAPDV|nr:hypothetical protein SDRG_01291 [Saprolegnia diclina VS20]EQC41316.1 hypothetical protein SDRG_01291 [Saprolegnia diclina VS20]|eukprot:XP_008605030.1 hypothetical protein SDRG_01291 [Saprolegnia diclina VS20]
MRLVVAVVAALLCLGTAQLPCASYTPLEAVLETCVSYDMPGPNTAHVFHTSSAIASSSALVVVGGYSISTGQPVITNTVQVYSPSSPQTAVYPTLSIASGGPKTNTQQFLPGSRIEHSAIVWEDAIFIYAGTNTDIMGDLWRLCVVAPYTSGIWDQVLNATTYTPIARTGHSTTTLLVNATSSVHLVFGGTLAYSYAASNDTVFMVLTKPSPGLGCQSAVPSVTWQPVTLLPNTSSPLGRAYHSMTLNRDETSRSCFVLYGGQSLFNNSIFNDVWTLCPTLLSTQARAEQQTYVWTQLEQLGTTPPPRFGHTAVASYTNRFVVVGGSFRFPSDYMSDGWEFNLALLRWLQLPLAYTNGSLLSPRRAHSTNYLNATKTLVILGGVGRYALVTGNSIQCAYTSAQCASGLVQVYCNATGQIVCQPCAAGSYAASGDAACSTCPPGTYAVEGASACTPCPLGTYSGLIAAPSLASCLSCPQGTYSSIPQATSAANCTQCPAGTFAAQAGSGACSPCSAGYYSVGNATQCSACPGGTFSAPQAPACTNCSAGTYAPSMAMDACLGCPRGMYSNASALSCTACPLGTFSAQTQASWAGCAACPMGSFGARTGLAKCSDCPDGTYSAVVGSASAVSCVKCPSGTFSNANTTKAAACTPCGLGTYASATGAAGCTPCPLDTITLATAATTSTLCVSCPIGSQRSLASATCEACPPGTHRLSATAGCILCPYGTYTSSLADAQNPQCIGCSPMTFSNNVGSTACTSCAPGTYALNQWAACLPCSPACPIGRNGGVCSYHGTCSYGGCSCSDGFSGVACQTLAPGLPSTTAANASGVLYFATPNWTLLFDNVSSNAVLLARDGGYLGTLSVVVALAGGNGSASNGGLPSMWATTVTFAPQQTSMSLSLPVAAISSGQGCTSIALSLRNLNLNAGGASNVSLTDSASLTLLVLATRVPTTALLQAPSTANGMNATVLVATTQSSSLSILLALPAPAIVETYLYVDASFDQSYTPLLPALLAAVQQKYEAQGVDWHFASNLNAALSTFGYAASTLLSAVQAITVDATSPFNAAPLLATNFLASIPWSPGARRTLLVMTNAPSINTATTTSSTLRTACVAANVVPLFLVPTAKQSIFNGLVQSFGAVVGFNVSTFPASAWQALQTPCTPVASISSTPTNSLLQSAAWNTNAVTLTFRRAVLGSDPAQMTSLVTVLGVAVLRISQLTFSPSCANSVAVAPSATTLAGWLPPVTTLASAQAIWTAQSSASSLALLSAANQSLVLQSTALDQNASYSASFPVQLERGTPVVLVGYVNTNIGGAMTAAASIELVVNQALRFPVSLPVASSSSAFVWQFFALEVSLPQITSQLQLVVNASRALGVASLGLFVDGPYSCSCASGNYMRAGVCSRCPTGSACAGGIKQTCTQQTFSFGAASSCKPCYPGWTCSGGFATPCPLGTYTLDATSCVVCPAGSACRQGLRSTCGVGTFAPSGAPHCSRCLPGTFANVTGSSVCLACPPGQSSNYMRDHCLPCAPGGYANAPGSYPCVACPANAFAPSGQSTCAACPSGTWTPSAGAQQCEPCPLGVC